MTEDFYASTPALKPTSPACYGIGDVKGGPAFTQFL